MLSVKISTPGFTSTQSLTLSLVLFLTPTVFLWIPFSFILLQINTVPKYFSWEDISGSSFTSQEQNLNTFIHSVNSTIKDLFCTDLHVFSISQVHMKVPSPSANASRSPTASGTNLAYACLPLEPNLMVSKYTEPFDSYAYPLLITL